MIVHKVGMSGNVLYTASHGIMYVCADFGGGLYGTNVGLVMVANT